MFGGAIIADQLEKGLGTFSCIGGFAKTIAIGIVVVVITYLFLVIGELVPKRIALINPRGISVAMAASMSLLARFAAPLTLLLNLSTNGVLRVLRVRPKEEVPYGRGEIRIMIEESRHAGILGKTEQDLVNRVLSLADRGASDLMTPRPDIIFVDIDTKLEKVRERVISSGHSQFPVFSRDPDNILGIVSIKALWALNDRELGRIAQSILRQPLFVPEVTPALKVVEL